MNAWNEYIALLEESAGLASKESRALAEADAAYNSEARRLQNELALAQRDLKAMRDRNTRLQVSVRDLVRTLGIATPATSELPPLAASQLGDAMKSAEYDLDQVRKSVEYMKAQRELSSRPAAPVVPAVAPTPMIPPPAEPAGRSFPTVPVLVGTGVGVLVLIVLAVILL